MTIATAVRNVLQKSFWLGDTEAKAKKIPETQEGQNHGIILMVVRFSSGKVVDRFGTFDPWVRMKPVQQFRHLQSGHK
jgi:hypothetical protein